MTNDHDPSRRVSTSRIPDFRSREEEAAFWDTHDFTEFLDETRPVKLRVTKNLSEGLTVRLDRWDREELERRAAEQGIGPSTLVRMWIKDRLRQGGGQSPAGT
jgi:CopG antitoxin of type II toxin-antitoxin system